jgi:hypothetical protein
MRNQPKLTHAQRPERAEERFEPHSSSSMKRGATLAAVVAFDDRAVFRCITEKYIECVGGRKRHDSVHSVPRESLKFGDISVHGRGRMDNLLKVHS